MILIFDFGAQYTQLIARKIRQLNVKSEIVPFNEPIARVRALRPEGIVLSGGPASIYAKGAPKLNPALLELGVPVLGICYGLQALTNRLGGHVERGTVREYGRATIAFEKNDPLFAGIKGRTQVWMSHGDRVEKLARGFQRIGWSEDCPFAAVRDAKRRIWGVQFHPEVHHTPKGERMLANFVLNICKAKPIWRMGRFVEQTIEKLRAEVGDRTVICGVSGGVDSTVLAVLLHQAVGDRLQCVFVDHGLMRHDEARVVVERFRDRLGIRVRHVRASGHFLRRLKGVADPERKRRIIGREFVHVFFRELKNRMRGDELLAQGTLYPDVIESVSTKGPSATIKTHHNRVKEITDLIKQGRVVEPLKELFKDEVREVGKQLRIPRDLLWRHPFPGPGLAVRILGAVTSRRLKLLRMADRIYLEELKKTGHYDKIWQAFGVLLPVRSVGVMGDERTYDHVLALRAVTSVDGMTADWYDMPKPVLGRISNRIINEIDGINRVVYDVSSKPPATIEWE
jgi:GMP synthase (glutamine-hydrolysing)